MQLPESIKRHWPIIVGAGVGLGLLLWIMRHNATAGSGTASVPGGVQYIPYAGGTNPGTASQVSAQLQEDTLAAQINATNQQNEIAYISALGDFVGKATSGVAQVYAAENALPAAAISAAASQNQTALQTSAAVAVQGLASLPGVLDSAAKLTAASYLPVAAYAQGVAGIDNTVAQSGSNVTNSAAQSMNSSANAAASSAGQAAAANASSTSSTMATIGTVAMIALMFL